MCGPLYLTCVYPVLGNDFTVNVQICVCVSVYVCVCLVLVGGTCDVMSVCFLACFHEFILSGLEPHRSCLCTKQSQSPVCLLFFPALFFLLIVVKVPTVSSWVAAYTPLFYAIIYSLWFLEFSLNESAVKRPIGKGRKS